MNTTRYEFLKLCSIKIIPFLILIFLLSLFFVHSGITQYKNTIKDIETALDIEKLSGELNVSYEQYGILGIHLFLKSSPLTIFFSNSGVLKELESKINTSEIVKIYFNARGAEILKKTSSGLRDLGGILNILGSLLMLVSGAMTFKNREFIFKSEKKWLSRVIPRLLILNGYFIFLMVSMYLFAIFNRIRFSPDDLQKYIIFIFVTILFLNLWYIKGIFFSLLSRYKVGLLFAVTLWALIMIAIPETRYLATSPQEIPSEKKVNLVKMKKLLESEQEIKELLRPLLKDKKKNIDKIKEIMKSKAEEYAVKGARDNQLIEQDLHNQVIAQITGYEKFSCLLPWSFYLQLQESISSKGYAAYIGFVDFVLEMKNGFLEYIIRMRYNSDDSRVIPYIERGGNVYQSHSVLPRGFLTGILSILVFSVLFFVISSWLFRRRVAGVNPDLLTLNVDQLRQSKSFFFRCKDKAELKKYSNYLSLREDVGIIASLGLGDYAPGTSLKSWIRYICSIEGLDVGKVQEMLGQLQVSDSDLKLREPKITTELFKKVYLALKLGERKKYYVLEEFFRGESEDFEIVCKALLRNLPFHFLYLSTERLKEAETSENESRSIIGIDWFDESIILR